MSLLLLLLLLLIVVVVVVVDVNVDVVAVAVGQQLSLLCLSLRLFSLSLPFVRWRSCDHCLSPSFTAFHRGSAAAIADECGGGNRMHYSRRFAGFNYAATNSKAKPAGSFGASLP